MFFCHKVVNAEVVAPQDMSYRVRQKCYYSFVCNLAKC